MVDRGVYRSIYYIYVSCSREEAWIEEEAAAFVKVVSAKDPHAPCPKCVSEVHNVCSTSLRSVHAYIIYSKERVCVCVIVCDFGSRLRVQSIDGHPFLADNIHHCATRTATPTTRTRRARAPRIRASTPR
jgi:hypothetical protein